MEEGKRSIGKCLWCRKKEKEEENVSYCKEERNCDDCDDNMDV